MAVQAPASEAPRLGTPLTAKLARSLTLSSDETALLAELQTPARGGRAGRAFPARNLYPIAGYRARRGPLLFDAADARSHGRRPRALRGACEPKLAPASRGRTRHHRRAEGRYKRFRRARRARRFREIL